MICLFVELSRYYNLLEDLHKKANAGGEMVEDHGFDEQDIQDKGEEILHEIEPDNTVPGSKHVVLYNVVRKTFKQMIHLCVFEKYGLAKTS